MSVMVVLIAPKLCVLIVRTVIAVMRHLVCAKSAGRAQPVLTRHVVPNATATEANAIMATACARPDSSAFSASHRLRLVPMTAAATVSAIPTASTVDAILDSKALIAVLLVAMVAAMSLMDVASMEHATVRPITVELIALSRTVPILAPTTESAIVRSMLAIAIQDILATTAASKLVLL